MRILVTGGAGWLGSALVKQLIAEKHVVTIIDNLSRGNLNNLMLVIDKPNFNFSEHDLTLPLLKPSIISLDHFDVIFDLAARVYGITKLYVDEPAFFRENTRILLSTLEEFRDKVDHYFQVSSSCIYNFEGCPLPHKEEYATKIPKTGYDISKRFGEEIGRVYAETYGFKYTVIRPFNVYGPNESGEASHVVTDFLQQIIAEKQYLTDKFWILGTGEQTRSFTYVKDLVDAMVFLMNRGEKGVFNVGTGVETRIIDLLKLMFEITGLNWNRYEIVNKPAIKGDVQKRCPDITKITSLGWKPKYSLRAGLEETWRTVLDEVKEELKK